MKSKPLEPDPHHARENSAPAHGPAALAAAAGAGLRSPQARLQTGPGSITLELPFHAAGETDPGCVSAR
jgi:hypothetical protein